MGLACYIHAKPILRISDIGRSDQPDSSQARSNLGPVTRRPSFSKTLRGKEEAILPAFAEAPAWRATPNTDWENTELLCKLRRPRSCFLRRNFNSQRHRWFQALRIVCVWLV